MKWASRWTRFWVRFARALPAALTVAGRRVEKRRARLQLEGIKAWFRGIRVDAQRRRAREEAHRANVAALVELANRTPDKEAS